jgi:HAD superfamily hydrolase (TIGR01509 family)
VKQFDAVIFDMDGLLLDTERIALACFHETCEHFGIGNDTELFMRCVGTNAAFGERVLSEGLQGKVDHFCFAEMWDAKYVRRTSNAPIPLKDGAAELLEKLAAAGLPLAVATSTASTRAVQKLKAAGIFARFAAVVGGDQVPNSKPHPDIFLKAAEALGVRPEKCLALEDSENGVRSATAAGMTVVQIPDLVTPSPALCGLGHLILDSLHDVWTYAFQDNAAANSSGSTGAHRSTRH